MRNRLQQSAMEETLSFIVCAQFIGEAARHIAQDECDLYLGDNNQWTSFKGATRFRSREAAELALQEKWQRLRNSGNRSIILSILESDT